MGSAPWTGMTAQEKGKGTTVHQKKKLFFDVNLEREKHLTNFNHFYNFKFVLGMLGLYYKTRLNYKFYFVSNKYYFLDYGRDVSDHLQQTKGREQVEDFA